MIQIRSFKSTKSLLLILGIGLCLFQWLYNRSIYLDEASLALNIIDRDFLELLKPLDHEQAAPILLLVFSKLISLLFGHEEIILRFIPLIFGLTSIFLIYPVVYLLCRDQKVALLSLLLFVLSPIFIRYSTEFKQYSTDLFVLLLFAYYYLNEKTNNLWFGLIGLVSLFFSHITVFLLGILSLVHISKMIIIRTVDLLFLKITSMWASGAVLFYFIQVRNNPTQAIMTDFWSYAFMPLNCLELPSWLANRFFHIFHGFFSNNLYENDAWKYQFTWIVLLNAILCILGFMKLLKKKNYKVLFFCSLPIIIHLLVSAFKVYPFSIRNALYLIPLFHIFWIIGLLWVTTIFKISFRYTFTCIFIFFMGLLYCHFPYKNNDVSKAILYINKHAIDGENIYVFRDITPVIKYYQTTKNAINNPVVYGKANIVYPEYLNIQEYDRCTQNFWMIFSHTNPTNMRTNDFNFSNDVISGELFMHTDENIMIDFLLAQGYCVIDKLSLYKTTVYKINK